MRKPFKAAIFDFDGVVVDTEKVGSAIASRVYKREAGITLTKNQQEMYYGITVPDFFIEMNRIHSRNIPVENLVQAFNPQYRKAILTISSPMPGIKELVQWLHKNDVTLSICSGSYRSFINRLLRKMGLNTYFGTIISYESTKYHKPHSQPYQATAEELGISPSHCVVFEDSDKGIESANKAMMKTVGIELGGHGTQSLSDAWIRVKNAAEAKKAIDPYFAPARMGARVR